MPERCARCKRRQWNGVDYRDPNPFARVAPGSAIEKGQQAPPAPSFRDLLQSLTQARAIIADVIDTNASEHDPMTGERAALERIDGHIAELTPLTTGKFAAPEEVRS